ncbi:Alpha-L-Rha alpha-1,3-L-rhamnosyltransferase [Candidatus Rhodobacter oscarellae]|uniref:Alpha-L-Rha alpha-1,3-L-rhamnosyltransferase n=1 Tax=Candidatus Rhodobacter oscarellae TaxID=1675527 RepID=A0A0J9EAL4_9RHOB|nr:glycosyltransferase [Candidatus Rhodobacter lobularis]KMW59835.1 Alpha-L-Rha alpha-1,3-L-rhamnosyltransferase [Candidatus Rhodobacter lobularis]
MTPSATPEPSPAPVLVLMATLNGGPALQEQLDSLSSQQHTHWRLHVSDDGSTDGTLDTVAAFAKAQAAHGRDVAITSGPGRGFVANFLGLLAGVRDDPAFVALCDQDDVWLPDRLQRGVEALSKGPADQPGLYCSRSWVVDQDLQNPRISAAFPRPATFGNALVQNIAPGNTILLNAAAAQLARAAVSAAQAVPGLPAHDWWLYQLVTGAGGLVIWDPEPTLRYRQHRSNQIGANKGFGATTRRFSAMLAGRSRSWTDANLAALRGAAHLLSPESATLLEAFDRARRGTLWVRLTAPSKLGIYRNGTLAQAALLLSLALRRL